MRRPPAPAPATGPETITPTAPLTTPPAAGTLPGARRRAALVAAASGLVATAVYLAATAAGAAASPGYSHVADPISGLTTAGAPHRTALAAAYGAYNLAVAGMGLALRRVHRGNRLATAGAWLLGLGAVAGIGQVTLFPQDVVGGPTSATGVVHLVLAGVSALITVVATALYGLVLRADGRDRAARFSLRCTVIIALSGPLAAACAGSELMGAAERVPIGTFLVWVTGIALSAPRRGR